MIRKRRRRARAGQARVPDAVDPDSVRDDGQAEREAYQPRGRIEQGGGLLNGGVGRNGLTHSGTHQRQIESNRLNNKGPGLPGPLGSVAALAYFSEALIELNLPFRVVPRPFTAAMIASEMPAAIRPYSMAVAPDSSFMKRARRFFIG